MDHFFVQAKFYWSRLIRRTTREVSSPDEEAKMRKLLAQSYEQANGKVKTWTQVCLFQSLCLPPFALLGLCWPPLCCPHPGSTLLSKQQSPAIIWIAAVLVPPAGLTCLWSGCSREGLTWVCEQGLKAQRVLQMTLSVLLQCDHINGPPWTTLLNIHAFVGPLPQGLGSCLSNLLWPPGHHQQRWCKQELHRQVCISLALLEPCHLVHGTRADIRMSDHRQRMTQPRTCLRNPRKGLDFPRSWASAQAFVPRLPSQLTSISGIAFPCPSSHRLWVEDPEFQPRSVHLESYNSIIVIKINNQIE